MNFLINLPIFQSIFLILPEVIFIVFIISLVVYGLITPMIAKAGDITENYSVYFFMDSYSMRRSFFDTNYFKFNDWF
jgi:p-aminobenzoyl-glutamate transporter AbgT